MYYKFILFFNSVKKYLLNPYFVLGPVKMSGGNKMNFLDSHIKFSNGEEKQITSF